MERSSTPRRRARALRRSLALSAAAALTLGAVSSAQASFPGADGKIAGQIQTFDAPGFTSQIYVVEPDATGLTPLTADPVSIDNLYPEWSPDGAKIAFQSNRDTSGAAGQIHVMNADGSGRVNLGVNGEQPAWSPDGTTIVFSRFIQGGTSQLFTMTATGAGVTQLTTAARPHLWPDWSPDGTKIAFQSDDGIYVVVVATGVETRIAGGDGANYDGAEWSADGAKVFYHRNGFSIEGSGNSHVWSVNPDGTSPTELTGTTVGGDVNPSPAPSGSRVAYHTSTGPPTISTMNPDGSNQQVLASLALRYYDWQPTEQVDPPELAPLEVSKTADPSYTVRHLWDIDKWASTKAGWDAKDSSLAVRYTVRVRHEVGDAHGVKVSGQIRIHNPNAVAVPVSDVDDSTEGATSCTTGAAPSVPAGGTVYVPYECSFELLPQNVVTNTASVYWNDGRADRVTRAQVPVDFSQARVYNDNAWVKVTDTLDGDKTRVLADHLDRSKTFGYTAYLKAWPGKCRVWHNTARLIGYEHRDGGPTNGVPIEPQTDLRVGMDGDQYAFTKTTQEWVKVCAPPDPPKDDPTVNPKPPTVIVGGDKPGPQPVKIVDADNPKGPVVEDPNTSRGALRVHKRSSVRRAQVGDTVIWSIRVANTGKADLRRVHLLDRLPRHLVVVASGQASNGRSVKSTARRIRIAVGDLAVGQKRTYRIATRVVARPRVTPKVVASAKRLDSRTRKVLLTRSRRGIVCNRVMANAPDTRARFSTACLRIVPAPIVIPTIPND